MGTVCSWYTGQLTSNYCQLLPIYQFWGWGGDSSQVYGDGVGMEKISWGWGGNWADFLYDVTLYFQ